MAEEGQPSRRERRRAKRRERRIARGRRLITFRTLLFVILLGAVLAGAFYAVRWYDTNSYFVGVNNNELVIYQGRIGGFLWYNPVEVQRTGVTTADVPPQYTDQLTSRGGRVLGGQRPHLRGQPGDDEELPAQSLVPVLYAVSQRHRARSVHHGRLRPPDHGQGSLMERRIRRLGIFMVLCFVALFIQLNNIQVLKANSLANNAENPACPAGGAQPDPGRASCRPTG